jgi:hypothetical protein
MEEYIIAIPNRKPGEPDPAVVRSEIVGKLVRCKDCIHYRYYGLSEETVSECRIDHCENPDADWFCADGERKTDNA